MIKNKKSNRFIDFMTETTYNKYEQKGSCMEGDIMIDMNQVIADNIIARLKEQNKKQTDLAEAIGTSKQTVNKMLNGSRSINAVELKKIAEYLGVKMEELTQFPEAYTETNMIPAFMGKVTSGQAEEALRIADRLSEMIIFHHNIRENGIAMTKSWSDD